MFTFQICWALTGHLAARLTWAGAARHGAHVKSHALILRTGTMLGIVSFLVCGASAMAQVREVPRWRVRGALTSGVGGARDFGETITVFPITLELGVRLSGGLSATVAGQGVLMGATTTACGEERRANAGGGTGGLGIHFAN